MLTMTPAPDGQEETLLDRLKGLLAAVNIVVAYETFDAILTTETGNTARGTPV